MNLTKLYKVVAVVETSLESRVFEKLQELGAHTYTWFYTFGHGRYLTADDAEPIFRGHSQIRIEVVVPRERGEAMLEFLGAAEFAHRGVLAYLEAVEVAEPKRFD